jgi:hypothetical protein
LANLRWKPIFVVDFSIVTFSSRFYRTGSVPRGGIVGRFTC